MPEFVEQMLAHEIAQEEKDGEKEDVMSDKEGSKQSGNSTPPSLQRIAVEVESFSNTKVLLAKMTNTSLQED